MTKEQQIQTIRKKCIEANPSILDLVFGCRISINMSGEQKTRATILSEGLYHPEVKRKMEVYGGFGIRLLDEELTDFEILGRPIRLADVLLAIQSDQSKQPMYLLNQGGYLANTLWNLKSDNLEDQSEETLEFISNLLQS